MVANPALVKRMNIPKQNVLVINNIHTRCDMLLKIMQESNPTSYQFKVSLHEWRKLQSELQLLWTFKVDQVKWCEYKLPHCTCPKMDNDDMGGHYYFTQGCPVHGE